MKRKNKSKGKTKSNNTPIFNMPIFYYLVSVVLFCLVIFVIGLSIGASITKINYNNALKEYHLFEKDGYYTNFHFIQVPHCSGICIESELSENTTDCWLYENESLNIKQTVIVVKGLGDKKLLLFPSQLHEEGGNG